MSVGFCFVVKNLTVNAHSPIYHSTATYNTGCELYLHLQLNLPVIDTMTGKISRDIVLYLGLLGRLTLKDTVSVTVL
jgi:hypothetical protein